MSGDWTYDVDSGAFNGTTTMEPLDNATAVTTCLARSIRGPIMLPYSTTLTTIMRSIQIILYIIIFFLSMFLNSLVIVLVAKYKKLQTRSFGIALQIIVLNLLFTSTVYLFRPITAIANEWLFGVHLCGLLAYVNLTAVTIRAFLMLTFVVDRFLIFFFPFSYTKHGSKFVIFLSVLTWVLFAAFRVIAFPGILDCYAFLPTSHVCVHFGSCSETCRVISYTFIGLIFGPATILPIILYAVLYCKALKIKKRLSRDNSAFQVHKREWKATVTFFLLLLAVFILTTPAIIPPLVIFNVASLRGPSPPFYVISVLFQLLASFRVVADPIVILRHRDVRDILREIYGKMCCKCGKTDAQPQSKTKSSSF